MFDLTVFYNKQNIIDWWIERKLKYTGILQKFVQFLVPGIGFLVRHSIILSTFFFKCAIFTWPMYIILIINLFQIQHIDKSNKLTTPFLYWCLLNDYLPFLCFYLILSRCLGKLIIVNCFRIHSISFIGTTAFVRRLITLNFVELIFL